MDPLWRAEDDDGVVCSFEHWGAGRPGIWQLSMEEGPFSGYPTINLQRSDLIKLYHAIGNELMRTQVPEIFKEVMSERSEPPTHDSGRVGPLGAGQEEGGEDPPVPPSAG